MNEVLAMLTRSLMVFALVGGLTACSSEDPAPVDTTTGGSDSLTSTGGATGTGGGIANATGGTSGTGGSMETVTPAECEAMASSMIAPDCKACACAVLPLEVSKCDDSCNTLLNCAGAKCPGLTGTERDSCATAMCIVEITSTPDLGNATGAAGPAFEACPDVCIPNWPGDEDASTDADAGM